MNDKLNDSNVINTLKKKNINNDKFYLSYIIDLYFKSFFWYDDKNINMIYFKNKDRLKYSRLFLILFRYFIEAAILTFIWNLIITKYTNIYDFFKIVFVIIIIFLMLDGFSPSVMDGMRLGYRTIYSIYFLRYLISIV